MLHYSRYSTHIWQSVPTSPDVLQQSTPPHQVAQIQEYLCSDQVAIDGLLQFCIYWVTTVCSTASFRLQCTVKKSCQTFVNMVWCVVMFTRHVMQAIMGRAMRAVLREIKWALNLQPWTAAVVHQQCVRRCIFVDHHWIIFHLITSHLLRPDDRGIKSNLTPHKSLPYDQTHKSSQPVSKSNCQILSTRVPWWENQWQRRWEEMVNVRRNGRNCPT